MSHFNTNPALDAPKDGQPCPMALRNARLAGPAPAPAQGLSQQPTPMGRVGAEASVMRAACKLHGCYVILTGTMHWDDEMRDQFESRFGELTTQHRWWVRGYLAENGRFVPA